MSGRVRQTKRGRGESDSRHPSIHPSTQAGTHTPSPSLQRVSYRGTMSCRRWYVWCQSRSSAGRTPSPAAAGAGSVGEEDSSEEAATKNSWYGSASSPSRIHLRFGMQIGVEWVYMHTLRDTHTTHKQNAPTGGPCRRAGGTHAPGRGARAGGPPGPRAARGRRGRRRWPRHARGPGCHVCWSHVGVGGCVVDGSRR